MSAPHGLDREKLRGLGSLELDATVKGFPALPAGTTVDAFTAARPSLFEAGFLPPVMVLRESALDANIARLADFCTTRGLLLAPHGKTMMSPQLAHRQLTAGAWAVTVATVSQARVYRSFGATRILLANELVDPAGLAWAMAEMEADPSFELIAYVDSPEGTGLLASALAELPGTRALPVLVELGTPGGRTGNRTAEGALAVAAQVARTGRLELRGVSGFEGVLAHDAEADSLDTVRTFLRTLRSVARSLLTPGGCGRASEERPFLVSAGGSAYFDLVAEELADGWDPELPVQVVVRSGAYLTHDSEFFDGLSPFTRAPHGSRENPGLFAALEVWASVLSVPEPGLALLGAGKRDVPYDIHLPRAEAVRTADGTVRPLHSLTVSEVNDQHAYLRGPVEEQLAVGNWVRLGVSHPCTAFDKWRLVPLVTDDYRVIDCVRTFF
ncbi:alanine racemase [Streptomyces sp. N35]|uniref:alanine racemase n=1 Tax=Streptomyces sp. N35 TaxID=2795730 RepID=UPI0018F7745D|nr:alanine racemase [Streptomyces sp. N35]